MRQVIAARGVICLDEAGTRGSWVVAEEGRIVEVGSGDPPESSDIQRIDGYLLPGFIDSHVHLTTTGLYARGLDFREARSVDQLLQQLDAHLRSSVDEWVIGGNFDPGRNTDSRMPTAPEIDRVVGDRKVLISRADGHSCAVSSAALKMLSLDRGLRGIQLDDGGQPTGVLADQSNYETRRAFFGSLPSDLLGASQREGCLVALKNGVTCVHEMAGGSYMGDKDFDVLVGSRADLPIEVVIYLATTDVRKVLDAGLKTVGGDLFLDGSIGSHTAAMSAAYEDHPGTGTLYRDEEELVAWFLESARAGVQPGVHAIGDAAIDQALRCLEEAASGNEADAAAIYSVRPRIEHFECSSPEMLVRAAQLGAVASVQPAFDRYWGGGDGMYARRLGERAKTMNDFRGMLKAGLTVAGGSDSTVTPLDPLLGISSATSHSNPECSVTMQEALLMFTLWGAKACHQEDRRGSLEPGKIADFCVLDRDPISDGIDDANVLETWVKGRRVWSADDGFSLS